MNTIPFETSAAVEMRVGKIIQVYDFPEARKPAYKLRIDFGAEIGIKRSSAQITALYTKAELLHRLILAVVNFEPKQVGSFMSECLVCGVANANGDIVLLSVHADDVPLGSKVH